MSPFASYGSVDHPEGQPQLDKSPPGPVRCSHTRLSIVNSKIGTAELMVIIYFCVCGGPFGVEDAVHAAKGVSWVLVSILVMPWLWSIPVGLTVAELASAMPENGGYIVWISRAFGNFWGFQSGYWGWVSDVFDNSLYPVLFSDYLNKYLISNVNGKGLTGSQQYLIRLLLLAVVSATNLAGIQTVGFAATIYIFVSVTPFLLMIFLEVDGLSDVLETDFESTDDVHWGVVLTTVLWSFAGFDAVASVAGTVVNPQKTIPRAVFCSTFMILAFIFLCVATGFSVDPNWENWTTQKGLWAHLGYAIGGKYMELFVTLSALTSAVGLFTVLLQSSSWSLYAIALPGLLDIRPLLWLEESKGSPWVCVLVNSATVALGLMFDFSFLIQIDITLNCFQLICGALAFLKLRYSEPDLPRGYTIPGGTLGAWILLVPHILTAVVIGANIDSGARGVVLWTLLSGIVLWYICRFFADRRQEEEILMKIGNQMVATTATPITTAEPLENMYNSVEEVLRTRGIQSLSSHGLHHLGYGSSFHHVASLRGLPFANALFDEDFTLDKEPRSMRRQLSEYIPRGISCRERLVTI